MPSGRVVQQSPFGGDFEFPDERDHLTNTPNIDDPDGYAFVDIPLSGGQSAESIWNILQQVHAQFSTNYTNIDYNLNQNSNAYANTLLSIVGISTADYLAAATPNDAIAGFPSVDRNLLTDQVGSGEKISLNLIGSDNVDILILGDGDDNLEGERGNDKLIGGGGADILVGGEDSDTIDGGSGYDTAVFWDSFSNYELKSLGKGKYSVKALKAGSNEGTDTLERIEVIKFGTETKSIADWVKLAEDIDVTPPSPTDDTPYTPPSSDDESPNGVSNALLSVTPVNKAIEVGQSIALADLFPSSSWVDNDGADDIRWIAVSDRTIGGGYLTYNGKIVASGAVHEFEVADLVNWRFVAAAKGAVDDIGFNIIQADGDYSPKLTPGAIVTTKLPDEIAPPDNDDIVVEGTDITRLDLDLREGSSAEEGSRAKFTIQRRGNQDGDIVVQWTITGIGDDPADRRDFPAMSGTVKLRDGRGDTNFSIGINDDQIDEFNESFRVDLRVISGNAVFDDDDKNFTIIDNDTPLGIDPNVDDHGNSFATATVVADDTWARGFIETPGDRDFFKIDLLGGVGYEFILIKDNDLSLIGGDPNADYQKLPDPITEVYNSSGQLIATLLNTMQNVRWAFEFETPADGTYYMSVRQDGDNDVGQYFIKADVRVKADDFSADTSTIGELVVGGITLGDNERDNDVDWFAVDLEVGETYQFSLFKDDRLSVSSVNGANGNYFWQAGGASFAIRDETGTIVKTGNDILYPSLSANLLEFTATSTGTYYISVDGSTVAGDQLRNYVVSAKEIFERPASPAQVIQSDPSNVTDFRFAGIRDGNRVAIDDDTLTVNGETTSVIRFDLDSQTSQASYAAVELYLYAVNGSIPSNIAIDIPGSLLDNDSTFGDIGTLEFVTAVSAPVVGQWVTIEITDLYNQWVSGDRPNYGMVLSTTSFGGGSNIMSFYSSNYLIDPTLRPRLILDGPDIVPQVFGVTTGRMTEDENSVFGEIGLTGDNDFSGATATGKWGSIAFDEAGTTWTYTLDARAEVLKQGEIVRDRLTVTSESGFSQTIRVKVTGVDDETVIVGAGRNPISETSGKMKGSSVLFDIDADSQPSFVTGSIVGTYGRFEIGTDGTWSYSLHALGRLALGTGMREVDNFKVFATDGTSIRYSFKVKGTDDDLINRAGSNADLVYSGGIGNDTITTGSGSDVLKGGSGNDVLAGGRGNDRLLGGNGEDSIYGNNGSDRLVGGNGNDKLKGGQGRDVLDGGSGRDILIGGKGHDDFVFKDNYGTNIVKGFDATDNREDIDLSGLTAIKGFADLKQNYMSQVGAKVVIDDQIGTKIVLINTDIDDLHKADFIF